jgi:hypothetical protein
MPSMDRPAVSNMAPTVATAVAALEPSPILNLPWQNASVSTITDPGGKAAEASPIAASERFTASSTTGDCGSLPGTYCATA